MKKIFKSILVLFILMNFALVVQMQVATAVTTPLESLEKVGGPTGLPDFDETGQHPDAPPDFAQEGIGAVTSPILFAIDLFRLIVSTIAFLVVVFASVRLISTANEEEATKAKSTLLVGIIGLLVIQLANVMVKRMFFGEQGEAFEDISSAQIFANESVRQIRGVIGFLEVFVGATAVLVLVIRGFTLIASGGDEEAMTKAKSHVLYAIIGLIAVVLSEVVIRGVVFPDAGERLPDVKRGVFVIVTLTNYIAGFISILAFLLLFYAGYQYVISGGNEEATEKAKKIIMSSVIALILALGAFALVNTLVQFEPDYLDETTSQPEIVDTTPQ